MAVTAADVKKLRELTSLGMMDCKRALAEADGDFDKAIAALKEAGAAIAEKKTARETREGRIDAYVHNGRIAALVEVACETDFVAKGESFQILVRDLCMQVTATSPRYLSREDVPAEALEDVSEEEREDFLKQNCLLEQSFIKDETQTVSDLVKSKIAQTGENITVRRFARFELGKE